VVAKANALEVVHSTNTARIYSVAKNEDAPSVPDQPEYFIQMVQGELATLDIAGVNTWFVDGYSNVYITSGGGPYGCSGGVPVTGINVLSTSVADAEHCSCQVSSDIDCNLGWYCVTVLNS